MISQMWSNAVARPCSDQETLTPPSPCWKGSLLSSVDFYQSFSPKKRLALS